MFMTNSNATEPKVVSRDQWLIARKALLKQEKDLTHRRDALAEERQRMPWVKIEKPYTFDTPGGKQSLSDLFGDRSQLFVYHLMMGPEWTDACPSCSMAADGFSANLPHLQQHDVSFVAVSRAPQSQIDAFKKRMGWKFNWVSSAGSDFNRDFKVHFTDDELKRDDIYNFGTAGFPVQEAPGASVFAKDAAGDVFHTYSTYGRGLEELLGVYVFLDRLPKGRDEAGLPMPMAWVKHHDRYDAASKAHACCGS